MLSFGDKVKIIKRLEATLVKGKASNMRFSFDHIGADHTAVNFILRRGYMVTRLSNKRQWQVEVRDRGRK